MRCRSLDAHHLRNSPLFSLPARCCAPLLYLLTPHHTFIPLPRALHCTPRGMRGVTTLPLPHFTVRTHTDIPVAACVLRGSGVTHIYARTHCTLRAAYAHARSIRYAAAHGPCRAFTRAAACVVTPAHGMQRVTHLLPISYAPFGCDRVCTRCSINNSAHMGGRHYFFCACARCVEHGGLLVACILRHAQRTRLRHASLNVYRRLQTRLGLRLLHTHTHTFAHYKRTALKPRLLRRGVGRRAYALYGRFAARRLDAHPSK